MKHRKVRTYKEKEYIQHLEKHSKRFTMVMIMTVSAWHTRQLDMSPCEMLLLYSISRVSCYWFLTTI
jgi:hypothetical protein